MVALKPIIFLELMLRSLAQRSQRQPHTLALCPLFLYDVITFLQELCKNLALRDKLLGTFRDSSAVTRNRQLPATA